jgi:UDP-glucose 4-epimerase
MEKLNSLKGKTILVIGAAGFIGSNLCEKLVKDNKVIGIDNYFTGSTDNHIDGIEYIKGNSKDISYLMKGREIPDIIYHLGEYSRVEQSFEDIALVLDYNINGTKEVLEYVRKHKDICKLIYAGSSTKYSDIGKASSPYAWTKATNTELVKNYGTWFNINYVITYFYNVYGNREISNGKYATLIAKFISNSKNNKPLEVVSPGTQIRNFTHVDDTVNALVLVGEKGYGDGYGIGADESYSVLEIAKMFNTKIKILPERKGNRMAATLLNDKIKALGWKQKYKLKDYIKEI